MRFHLALLQHMEDVEIFDKLTSQVADARFKEDEALCEATRTTPHGVGGLTEIETYIGGIELFLYEQSFFEMAS